MVSGSELAADVFVTGRDSIVSGGSVGTTGVRCDVLGESCRAESEDDVDTFPHGTGAVGRPFRGNARLSSEELTGHSWTFCAVSPPWILAVLPKALLSLR